MFVVCSLELCRNDTAWLTLSFRRRSCVDYSKSGFGWHFLVVRSVAIDCRTYVRHKRTFLRSPSLSLQLYVLAMASTALAVLIGSAVEDPKMAMEFLPVLFVPQILFAGFFVYPEFIPSWYVLSIARCFSLRLVLSLTHNCKCRPYDDSILSSLLTFTRLRWAQWLCTLKYGVNLRLWYEWGYNTQCAGCQGLLTGLDIQEDNIWWYWVVLIALFFVFRIMGLMILRWKATKYY